jgi:hypothetical protein
LASNSVTVFSHTLMSASGSERGHHFVEDEAGFDHRGRQLVGLDDQRLLVELALRNLFALRIGLFVALVAGLFVAAQFVVDAVEHGARFGQRAIGAQAFVQRGLALGFQRVHRRVAFGELRGEFAQARVELAALAAHAFQRLREGDDLRLLRLDRERERVRGVARFTGGVARGVAGFGELAALGVELLADRFELAHAADGVFLLRTRGAGLVAVGVERLDQLPEFGLDAFDAAARRIQLALLALQLAGEFGHAAVREVERALRVFALLLGGERLVAQAGQRFVEDLFALLQRFDFRAQRLDFLFAQQRTLLRRTGAHHAHPAGAEAFARAGDHRFAIAQAVQHRAGVGQRFGAVELGEDAADRRRATHLRGERGRRDGEIFAARIDQRQAGLRRDRRAHRPALPELRPARLR